MARECTKPHVARGAHHGGGEDRWGAGGGGRGAPRPPPGKVGVGIQDIDMTEPMPQRPGRRGGAHFGWAFGSGGRGGHTGGRGGGRPGDTRQANLPDPHGADLTKYLKPGAPKPEFRKSRRAEPTVDQIQVGGGWDGQLHPLLTVGQPDWPGPHLLGAQHRTDARRVQVTPFPATRSNALSSPAVVKQIYDSDIKGAGFSIKRIMMLEFSQYLENFLWPNYSDSSSLAHLLSIVIVVNEKFRERVPAWAAFQHSPDQFQAFFHSVLKWSVAEVGEISVLEQTKLLIFLDHCFTSMEVDLVRTQVQKLVSLPMWACLLEARREAELKAIPKWKKFWKLLSKKDAKETPENLEKLQFERTFLSNMIKKFLKLLYTIQEKDCPEDVVDFVERFLILIIDLEALLPTRRFFNTVLDDSHLVVRASLAPLALRPEGRLFSQLLEQVRFYTRFEINDQTGEPLSDKDMTAEHYARMSGLQRAVFVKYPELRSLALATIASIEDREQLEKHFLPLERDTLYQVCQYLHLVPPEADRLEGEEYSQPFLAELVVSRHEKRDSQLTELNSMPLYPTEEFIWDENLVPGEYYQGENPLALPKLNLQFLTLHDYLLRNFKLFQLESTYEIRQDIEDVVARLRPWRAEDDSVIMHGWARMALSLHSFTIVEVAKPNIGERQPSRVRADVSVHLAVRDNIKQEWENLRRHDVCFLLTLRPPRAATNAGFTDIPADEYCRTTGLVYVRGCEVEGMLDDNGRVIEDFGGAEQSKTKFTSSSRTYRVLLDCNQYREDMDMTSQVQWSGRAVYL
jgi:intron-binding protein aquarius